jgi:hypothetical protein
VGQPLSLAVEPSSLFGDGPAYPGPRCGDDENEDPHRDDHNVESHLWPPMLARPFAIVQMHVQMHEHVSVRIFVRQRRPHRR